MSTVISCVVEGHGEVAALPQLVRRIVQSADPQVHLVLPQPNRQPRSRLVQSAELHRAVRFAASRVGPSPGGVLVLLDADDDCPKTFAPQLLDVARAAAAHTPVEVVLAEREYEAWFLAAASSLAGHRQLPQDLTDHPDPQTPRDAKGWLREHLPPGQTYSETVDQPPLTARLDLTLARQRASSFDKLCRAVHTLAGTSDPNP